MTSMCTLSSRYLTIILITVTFWIVWLKSDKMSHLVHYPEQPEFRIDNIAELPTRNPQNVLTTGDPQNVLTTGDPQNVLTTGDPHKVLIATCNLQNVFTTCTGSSQKTLTTESSQK